MVAAIGGIGSASQNVKWGRPAQDPQQAHFEASKAMKENSQPAQMSEHLKSDNRTATIRRKIRAHASTGRPYGKACERTIFVGSHAGYCRAG